uniref:hypothetical protein n=1 Tax=Pararhizobium sp. IMCC3301 TaxID=3067904 RepID=UPI002741C824|nr:hypothetical protein [Pararhizobium sp. IMCC3301]
MKKKGVAYLSDQKWVTMVRSTELKERFENFFNSGEIERLEVVGPPATRITKAGH